MWSTFVSTEIPLLVDRCHNLVLASTEIPVFMDKTAQLTILSTRTALFMDSPRFRWREYGQQATRLANMPASRSKQAARATPKGSLRCFVPRAKSPYTISFVASCPSSPHSSGQKLQDGVSAAYTPPTNPSVAMLMRTEGGKTVRRVVKQAIKVDPVVNTSSTSRMCRIPVSSGGVEVRSLLCSLKAFFTLSDFSSMLSRVWLLVLRERISMSLLTGAPSRAAMPSAITCA